MRFLGILSLLVVVAYAMPIEEAPPGPRAPPVYITEFYRNVGYFNAHISHRLIALYVTVELHMQHSR
jgi:hypothetical protein